MQWYYAKNEKQFGPVDDTELHRLAHLGEIQPDDLVWNESMGENWAPAASVESLFPSSDLSTSIPSDQPRLEEKQAGSTHNRDLMLMARESLQNQWGLSIAVFVLYQFIITGLSIAIPGVGSIATLLIAGPMMLGLSVVFLAIARRQEARIGQLFDGFKRFGTALAAYLLMSLFILLWYLLLIIPGIIATYAYSMTFYILADEPSIGAIDAISKSKQMMRGQKWKLFCLQWRFFWWFLVGILTLGIGFLWIVPYVYTSTAHFYDDVRTGNRSGSS